MQMLDTLKNLIGNNNDAANVEQIDPDNEENIILPDSTNASERHLLEYEEELSSEMVDMLGQDLSLTVCVNSAYIFWLLSTLNNLTPDFTGWIFHLLSLSLNSCISLNHLSGKKINMKYLILLTVARLSLTQSVNGLLINRIDSAVQVSLESKKTIIEEIKQFEGNNSVAKKPDMLMQSGIALSLCIMVVLIVRSLFNRKKDEIE